MFPSLSGDQAEDGMPSGAASASKDADSADGPKRPGAFAEISRSVRQLREGGEKAHDFGRLGKSDENRLSAKSPIPAR